MLLNTEIHEIELELTGTCNLDCPLCSRNNPAAQHLLVKNHRPVEEIIKTIETYPNLKRICIAGIISEPTLYKDFKRLIQYIGIRDLEGKFFALVQSKILNSTDLTYVAPKVEELENPLLIEKHDTFIDDEDEWDDLDTIEDLINEGGDIDDK